MHLQVPLLCNSLEPPATSMVAANRKNIKERRMLVFLHSWATRGMECCHLSHVRAKTHCFERPLSALFPRSWCTAFSKGRVDARTCCLLPLRPVQMGESKTWIAHGWLGKTSSLEGTGASLGQSPWTSSTHPGPGGGAASVDARVWLGGRTGTEEERGGLPTPKISPKRRGTRA